MINIFISYLKTTKNNKLENNLQKNRKCLGIEYARIHSILTTLWIHTPHKVK